MADKRLRIFSGIQPTGGLHLGNYLGALRNFVELQATHECIYCVVDLHAITAPHDPNELRQNTYEAVAAFLAAGVDADAHIIFNQARVAAHSELAWIFNCVARYGWLDRMTQFKEKVGKHRAKASVGLWVYPNLMAADILAYKAQKVPVGDDQRQHLELVRDIAQKFNHDFCPQDAPFFPLPEPLILKSGGRVMSLRDGTRKMSKSEPSSMSRILLTDDADAIAQKIRKAKTDALPCPADEGELPQRPEAANLVGIFAALANQPQAAVLGEYGGKPFSAFKADLAALTIATITPIGAEMARLLGDVAYLEQIMGEGAARAEAIARPIMKKVKELVGFAV